VTRFSKKVLADLIRCREKLSKKKKKRSQKRNQKDELGGHAVVKKHEFNAARCLYPSWRVTSLIPELPESKLIVEFTSPWPRRSREGGRGVTKDYEDDVILTATSQHLAPGQHHLDTFFDGCMGYLGVLLIRLQWAVNPWFVGWLCCCCSLSLELLTDGVLKE
jgi:hypothetical protein